jgi:hypothetical protein
MNRKFDIYYDLKHDKEDQEYLGNYLADKVIINYKSSISEYVLIQIFHHVSKTSPAYIERNLKECLLQKKIPINCLHNFEKNFKEENIERRYEYDVNNNDSTQSLIISNNNGKYKTE